MSEKHVPAIMTRMETEEGTENPVCRQSKQTETDYSQYTSMSRPRPKYFNKSHDR